MRNFGEFRTSVKMRALIALGWKIARLRNHHNISRYGDRDSKWIGAQNAKSRRRETEIETEREKEREWLTSRTAGWARGGRYGYGSSSRSGNSAASGATPCQVGRRPRDAAAASTRDAAPPAHTHTLVVRIYVKSSYIYFFLIKNFALRLP